MSQHPGTNILFHDSIGRPWLHVDALSGAIKTIDWERAEGLAKAYRDGILFDQITLMAVIVLEQKIPNTPGDKRR